LTVFGRSIRESNCDCDRAMDPSLLQTVFLQNDQLILNLLNAQDGWLNQLARVYKKAQLKASQEDIQDKQKKNIAKQLANFEKEIQRLTKKNAPPEKIEAAKARLVAFRQKVLGEQPQPDANQAGAAHTADTAQANANEPNTTPAFDAKQVITQAYLRTVSRYPSEQELARCEQFIVNEKDEITGLRQVLWALLNTKEFIVNH